jgi:hypothetical protein
MKINVNFFIYLFLIFFANSFNFLMAQENINNSSSNKKYETKTVKNQDQIEIRLIPKNPVNPPTNQNSEIDDEEFAEEIDQPNDKMIYQKSNGRNDFEDTKLSNNSKQDSLKSWREQQKKLREERIRQRDQSAKQKFLENKQRSVIKEMEMLAKIRNENALKNPTSSTVNNSSSNSTQNSSSSNNSSASNSESQTSSTSSSNNQTSTNSSTNSNSTPTNSTPTSTPASSSPTPTPSSATTAPSTATSPTTDNSTRPTTTSPSR